MVAAKLQGRGAMRFLGAMLAMLVLAQCATPGNDDFTVGGSEEALVIIGIAKSSRDTSARYLMLWRRVGADGAFEEFDDSRSFQPETNSSAVRVDGVPGEFAFARVAPGAYALDGVFGIIRDGRVDYVAQGVITGPDRPAFEVAAGEAIYLGIWEADIEDASAVVRPWRIDAADMRAAVRVAGGVAGDVVIRQAHTRSVPCTPHRPSTMSTRQVC